MHVIALSFYSSRYHRDLHSFPTRHSSDLLDAIGHRHDDAVSGRVPGETLSGRRGRGGSLKKGNGLPPTGPIDDRECLPEERRSEEHTSELQSLRHLVCRLLLEKKKKKRDT